MATIKFTASPCAPRAKRSRAWGRNGRYYFTSLDLLALLGAVAAGAIVLAALIQADHLPTDLGSYVHEWRTPQ